MQCLNPTCLFADNLLGQRLCDRCQTPLVYQYLWVAGKEVDTIAAGTDVNHRYRVISPHVWLDLHPGIAPEVPKELPETALPYLHLYPFRLHLPTVYGICHLEGESKTILLLENAPLDLVGQPYPAIADVWSKTTPVRQIYWLWQILQLWLPLQNEGVATSLLVANNLRVEGWRIRLQELYTDASTNSSLQPTLGALADVWLGWAEQSQPKLGQRIRTIAHQMKGSEPIETIWSAIFAQLNQLLLEQAAQMPLRLQTMSITTTGPQRSHNEDACYPPPTIKGQSILDDVLASHVAIICDGIGGHAGGEVASQLAIRSLQLQLRALLAETAEQTEIILPDVVMQQLEALVRVVNNMIASQNDEQGREARQRMGTTLVMALHLPQTISSETGAGDSHELYLAHIGDSRAYWITPYYCHLLTVDDDVANREVRLGRSSWQQAQQRSDATALTQALGTRSGEAIHPTVHRFILEEDGILLLCSDGISDNSLVERLWEQITRPFFAGSIALEQLLQAWVNAANQYNGHDNSSAVLMHCQMAPESSQVTSKTHPESTLSPGATLSEASRALLYDETEAEGAVGGPTERVKRSPNIFALTLSLLLILGITGAVGLTLWRQLEPTSFRKTLEHWFPVVPSPPPASPSPSS
jgi:protein phosphatase